MECPVCRGTKVGIIGNQAYFCRSCCLEFHGRVGELRAYAIAEDGTLTAVRKGEPRC